MNGSLLQHIDGTSTTGFYDLKIQNPNHVVRRKDFVVTDSLQLITGRLKLNNGLVTLTNTSPSALTFNLNAGDIQAEADVTGANVSPYGRLTWDMGADTGMRTIPFINASGNRIPMNYFIDSGTHQVTVGTYATQQDNLNWPLPDVTNILGMNNATGGGWGAAGWSMVDRYYLVNNSSPQGAQADITFRYAVNEQAQSGNADMRAQRWLNVTDLWEYPFQPGQLFVAGNPNQVLLSDYSGFSNANWWTVVGESTPLPISLLDFTAKKLPQQVKLLWNTASEINNSHFIVERTPDNNFFEFISRVESQGSGNNLQEYVTWDNSPKEGLQYYYLRQYDYNDHATSYGPVAVNFNSDLFEIITTVITPANNNLSVMFHYNSEEPFSYRVMDMTGRLISGNDRNEAVDGINVIDIDINLSRGAYFLLLQNSSKGITRKFFY